MALLTSKLKNYQSCLSIPARPFSPLLSGFFLLRRQYRAFAGSRGNGPATRLARRVLASGHAWTREYPGRALLYQLCSRQFYRAVGEEDSPFRRRKRRMPYIQRRVFALDFALAHLERQPRHLYTQDEKIEACLIRGADEQALSRRVARRRFCRLEYEYKVHDRRDLE